MGMPRTVTIRRSSTLETRGLFPVGELGEEMRVGEPHPKRLVRSGSQTTLSSSQRPGGLSSVKVLGASYTRCIKSHARGAPGSFEASENRVATQQESKGDTVARNNRGILAQKHNSSSTNLSYRGPAFLSCPSLRTWTSGQSATIDLRGQILTKLVFRSRVWRRGFCTRRVLREMPRISLARNWLPRTALRTSLRMSRSTVEITFW